MTQRVQEIMTDRPRTCSPDTSLTEIAQIMKGEDIGDVIVTDDGAIRGIVTDRDIVVRAVAVGLDPDRTRAHEVCSDDVTTLSPDDDSDHAAQVMRESGVRRMPIARDGTLMGVISLGDLAVDQDPDSALAEISAQRGNR